MQFVVPTLNTALELPRARTNSANFGYPDLYVVLLHLHWHKKRSDYVASLDKAVKLFHESRLVLKNSAGGVKPGW